MSVSLVEVIEAGGYDLSKPDDAKWLVSKKSEFEELVEFAENVIEEDDEKECEHEYTYTEDIENTAEYELNQSQGNLSAPLTYDRVEVCENCGKQRNLPEGEWE